MGGKKSVFFVFCRGSPGKYLFPSGVCEKLNRSFGFSKHIGRKHVIGEEVDKGHFGHTCRARWSNYKLNPFDQMTTTIAIEDVHWEVKILRALTGHNNPISFYDTYEDHDYVYLVMEGGKYAECDAKGVLIQMLSVILFCHLQGVVHWVLKPENFNNAELKAIDFNLSDFVCPEKELNDIVGSAYYVAPEDSRAQGVKDTGYARPYAHSSSNCAPS
ncbi:hypothetical protein E3N88_38066 [Mikania micrantha]|uniref:Protein kinase domain-containing protein n=1 Tax=Mikania micrantha TaxID=192012 RepID=A0A5N6LT26_9ASTR|nr:hypothetical protein E3N88_38066 [Mikania micrantha]